MLECCHDILHSFLFVLKGADEQAPIRNGEARLCLRVSIRDMDVSTKQEDVESRNVMHLTKRMKDGSRKMKHSDQEQLTDMSVLTSAS